MCGIVGYVGDKSAIEIIVEGLKRLEYRGYDSAGVAILHAGQLHVRRAAGRLKMLEGVLRERPVAGPPRKTPILTLTARGSWSSFTMGSSRITWRSRSASSARGTSSVLRPTPRCSPISSSTM